MFNLFRQFLFDRRSHTNDTTLNPSDRRCVGKIVTQKQADAAMKTALEEMTLTMTRITRSVANKEKNNGLP